jgi:hypothetical protein
MKKFIHPNLLKLYIRNLTGEVLFLHKGVKTKKELLTSSSLVDLKNIFGKKN